VDWLPWCHEFPVFGNEVEALSFNPSFDEKC
jgi:hypothetical protein